MTVKHKSGRGGRRPGAGRPFSRPKKMVAIRLPLYLVKWLRNKRHDKSQSDLIEEALNNTFDIEKGE